MSDDPYLLMRRQIACKTLCCFKESSPVHLGGKLSILKNSDIIGALDTIPGDSEVLMICHTKESRNRATKVAQAEVMALMRDLGASLQIGGPLSEVRGVFWVVLPKRRFVTALDRMSHLGYTAAIDSIVPLSKEESIKSAQSKFVRWRKRDYLRVRTYQEDAQAIRESAPDRREFRLATRDGIRDVKGYRGGGGPLNRRALPPCDARMLANMVYGHERPFLFLDPFAGAGGIVVEATKLGYSVVTVDNDPVLRFGLPRIGSQLHLVADSKMLPFRDNIFHGISTEPPYDVGTASVIELFLMEMKRVLRIDGRIAMLVAEWQAEAIQRHIGEIGLLLEVSSRVNRKGTSTVLMVFTKRGNP